MVERTVVRDIGKLTLVFEKEFNCLLYCKKNGHNQLHRGSSNIFVSRKGGEEHFDDAELIFKMLWHLRDGLSDFGSPLCRLAES